MAKQGRKYYQPGLISLSILPIICCIYFGYKCVDVKRQYAIQFVMSNKLPQPLFDKFPPKRNYEEIELTGTARDHSAMQKMERLIKTMESQKDTANGICVRLGNNINYQTFISIIDICIVDGASRFGLADDYNFYIAPCTYKISTFVLPPSNDVIATQTLH